MPDVHAFRLRFVLSRHHQAVLSAQEKSSLTRAPDRIRTCIIPLCAHGLEGQAITGARAIGGN
jgi:hypothetical protein